MHLAADAEDPQPDSLASWAELLESSAALEAFVRWQRGTAPRLTDVTAFLLLSRTFPRSVLRALQSAEDQLSRLESDASRSVCRRLLGGVRSELEFLDGHELTPATLTELFGRVRARLPAVSNALADRFFSPGETAGLYLHELRGGDAAEQDDGRPGTGGADEARHPLRDPVPYDSPVRESHNELRACPVDDGRQRVLDFRLRVDPATPVQSYRDYWGTRVEAFGVIPRHDRLDVIAEISVETHAADRGAGAADAGGRRWPSTRPSTSTRSPAATPAAAGLAELGREVVNGAETRRGGRPDGRRLGRRLAHLLAGATKVDTSVDEVVERRVGVCQDFAHLTVALCRAVGVPARYVSGYLFARRDDAASGADTDGTDGTGEADAVRVQTHAWVEVAVAPGRWQPLDPTNGREVGERHVKIGHGRDYFDVTPFHGSFSGSADPTLVSHGRHPPPLGRGRPAHDPLRRRPRPPAPPRPAHGPAGHRQDQQQEQQQQQQHQ